jgi:hypothetical protein
MARHPKLFLTRVRSSRFSFSGDCARQQCLPDVVFVRFGAKPIRFLGRTTSLGVLQTPKPFDMQHPWSIQPQVQASA